MWDLWSPLLPLMSPNPIHIYYPSIRPSWQMWWDWCWESLPAVSVFDVLLRVWFTISSFDLLTRIRNKNLRLVTKSKWSLLRNCFKWVSFQSSKTSTRSIFPASNICPLLKMVLWSNNTICKKFKHSAGRKSGYSVCVCLCVSMQISKSFP